MSNMSSIYFCSSPLSDDNSSTMDGRKHDHANMSFGRASAALESGAAQWEIEEGKAWWIVLCSHFYLFYI
jgi:hypothetical protein